MDKLAVSEMPLLSRDERLFKQVSAYYGAPAYVRRANHVQNALEAVLHNCRSKRAEWLLIARLRLGRLQMLAGDWKALRPLLLDDTQVDILQQLEAILEPTPRLRLACTSSSARLRRALIELVESLERFNARWQKFLAEVDLGAVNEVRANYNRYYVLEKECALRSPRLARQGFVLLAPLTQADLLSQLPLLPVPRVGKR